MATILIIDDDPVYGEMMQQRLMRSGHQASVHVGPFGGTIAARKAGIDLVILDVFMPGLDGASLLDLMHRDRAPGPKVVFCSSMDPQPLRELAERHQADGWIPKSATRKELVDCLDQVLARAKRHGNPSAV